MSFLDDVLETKRLEVEALRRHPPSVAAAPAPPFSAALRGPGLAVIAEIKRRSPSKGQLVAPGFDVARTARAYADGGAVAISCLTDARYFGAVEGDLGTARAASALPVLRKDFVIDELQIDESLALGASAILLIVRILEEIRLRALLEHARRRGLDALVEVHEEAEIDAALRAGATILGVNNRNLGTLEVDPARALRLRRLIPRGVLSVAESGVKTRDDLVRIESAGFDAVLIGETLVKSPDPSAALRELRGPRTWIKVCGITSVADAEAAILAGVSAIGLVMTSSARQVTVDTALSIARAARGRVEIVGVFREAADAKAVHDRVGFDRIQLHARDSFEAPVPVLRAVPFEDLEDHVPREGELLVVDSSEGRGVSFDWTGLGGIAGPFVIAGGLDPENVGEAIAAARPFGVDVSSGVEITPGWKDPGKMTRFVDAVRRADEKR